MSDGWALGCVGLALVAGVIGFAVMATRLSGWRALARTFGTPFSGSAFWAESAWCQVGAVDALPGRALRTFLSVRVCDRGITIKPLLLERFFCPSVYVPWECVKHEGKKWRRASWDFWRIGDVHFGFPASIGERLLEATRSTSAVRPNRD